MFMHVVLFLFDCIILEDFEQNVDGNVSENSTSILKLANIANNERTINCLSSAASMSCYLLYLVSLIF